MVGAVLGAVLEAVLGAVIGAVLGAVLGGVQGPVQGGVLRAVLEAALGAVLGAVQARGTRDCVRLSCALSPRYAGIHLVDLYIYIYIAKRLLLAGELLLPAPSSRSFTSNCIWEVFLNAQCVGS